MLTRTYSQEYLVRYQCLPPEIRLKVGHVFRVHALEGSIPSSPTMPNTNIDKRRAYSRNWMAKRRGDWFAKNGPCVSCGSHDNLQLDHIDPDLKVDHKVWSWSLARREAELRKCQVLCIDCHKTKTARQRREKMEHGTLGMYGICGPPRCSTCKKAMRDWKRGRRGMEDALNG